ncbi:MAG: DNA polymerase III subunit gamma/tau [Candidatus Paracaedimonas acanthamoebae]|uniref:DNA polymerase III subunit gamma/tau n=1 Tax=Candidatus Paracaedimonas acanthamoebae TaxID=244581 RepID=A0A8J7Q189_9PROT|nr:DNA polymerase III subunit gamma/tau [Candidatus Paracaedimonas acanthamoebae]
MTENSTQYLVLARKYRPTTFADLIGQDTLVRVLGNGIKQNRLPHAFILTGIRGTGKTTTARIIARALNCIGLDGKGNPTPSPCGACEHCRAISEDRHIDVIEMDAASRTGIDDIREVIEASRYRAVSARYKVYIIDEVHMLSKNAFNALLKTLEEPPSHVKFIFATTEIRKIPDTILSRCMRFDLKRIDEETLKTLFNKITLLEGKTIEEEALNLIARAADGSARDGLSILDQAIMLSESAVTGEKVRKMLGLMDQTYLIDLATALVQGDTKTALNLFQQLNQQGTEPLVVLKDLLSFIHWLSTKSVTQNALPYPGLTDQQTEESNKLAQKLNFPLLVRFWQSLIKGIQEVSLAPLPEQAVEMVLMKLCYLSHLPTPQEIIQNLGNPSHKGPEIPPQISAAPLIKPEITQPAPQAPQPSFVLPKDFKEVVALCQKHREPLLEGILRNDVHLVSFELGKISFCLSSHAPKDLASRLKSHLKDWTGIEWEIIVQEKSENVYPSLQAQYEIERSTIRETLLNEPLVKAAQKSFPESQVVYVDDIPKEKME